MLPALITFLMMVLTALQPAVAGEVSPLPADAADGAYRFHYATAAGVSGDCDGFRITVGGEHVHFHGRWPADDMEPGPAWVTVTLRAGAIRRLDLAVGDCAGAGEAAATDLGPVAAAPTAVWLVELARTAPPAVAEAALSAATVARDADLAAPLIGLARDRRADREVRTAALHWCAVLAGEAVIEPVRHLIADRDEDMEVRENAVFALAQLEQERALELLLEIGRDHDEPQLRRMALFALGQHDDERIVALFEEILLAD